MHFNEISPSNAVYMHVQTLDKVVIAKKALTEMEQKLLLSRKKADAERREREHKLAASRRKLRKAECVLQYNIIIEYDYVYLVHSWFESSNLIGPHKVIDFA